MATVGDDPLVRLRDVRTGRLSNELIRPSERGMSLAFSPDGSRIVTVRLSDVSVWHAETRELLAAFGEAHDHINLEVAFSPNGRPVAALCSQQGSGAGSSVIKIWDAVDLRDFATGTNKDGVVTRARQATGG